MDLDIYACDWNIYIREEKNFYFIFGKEKKIQTFFKKKLIVMCNHNTYTRES
jgi:hypothetical protein